MRRRPRANGRSRLVVTVLPLSIRLVLNDAVSVKRAHVHEVEQINLEEPFAPGAADDELM